MALPKQSEDFPAWYQEVVKQADLAEPSFARGTAVIKPYGYAIWEAIQAALDFKIKETGHTNFYFPLFFPYSLLEKEAEHIKGFAPEVAVVTHAGGNKLEEPLVVRPTSEAVIWGTYAKWIHSYRDLPLLHNQWANVVRWELRPRLFLRTTEFLWQEGHTAHETAKEAREEAEKMLGVYRDIAENTLGIPVVVGRKSASERFPGAEETLTIEALMRDGKALQAGTSHDLGQNFAKTYDVKFLGRDGKEEYAYASSWGMSTRVVGGLIMTHGDDQGLRLPPSVAPYQVVVVPIYKDDKEKKAVLTAVDGVRSADGLRIHVDDREERRPGYKFNEWEQKGAPLRVEVGPREVAAKEVVVARRDTGTKETVKLSGLQKYLKSTLEEVQAGLSKQAKSFLDEHSHQTSDYGEMAKLLKGRAGFVYTGWCEGADCEAKVKKDTTATIRCLPFEQTKGLDTCPVCGKPAKTTAIWAQAY